MKLKISDIEIKNKSIIISERRRLLRCHLVLYLFLYVNRYLQKTKIGDFLNL